MQESIDYCIFSACTMSSQRKFTFAISSPDEFLVIVDYDILLFNLTHCIMCTTHDGLTAF